MESILSDGKIQRLRWKYQAQDDLLPITFTSSSYIMLGKQEYFCLQGKDYNKGKKDKCIEKKNVALKQDHVFRKSRKNTQPTKKLDCPVKFCVTKIYQFTSYKDVHQK